MASFSLGSERNPLETESGDYKWKVSARAENPCPVSETWLGFSARTNGLKNPQKVYVIEMEFQPLLKRQREHAQ